MSSTDIAALLNDQKNLSEGKARLVRLKKESVYHLKQGKRKADDAITLEAEIKELEAKLQALTDTSSPPPSPAAQATEQPKAEKKK